MARSHIKRNQQMTPKEFYTDMWEEMKGFNSYLEEKGMKKVNIAKSLFSIEKKPLTLAIYPTASSGSTYSESNEASEMMTTFQMYCNRNATEEGAMEALDYYSTLIEWLHETTFGKYSEISNSVLCRMDEGEPVNGFVLFVTSKLEDLTDCGWG